jgi:lipopolysaccharide transport system ATP-binding protein
MSNGSSMSEVNSPGINFQAPAANNDYALATQHSDHIWALKGACFEVKKGEVVGIIGPNGSGKSTLLKLLSQITDPSEGEILIDGRVTALIELGAAFHPELTGRENIYLNGAILGLTKKEVDARFKQIVDFAEVWDFIDTPVKRYASGMTVRLGFAVAVSVDPEILLVDEGLAVGDAAFRTRCFERIDAFIRAGKTLIIVTHSLEEISRLASRGILIDRGVIKADGLPDDVIAHYTRLIAEKAVSTQPALAKRQGKDATDRG